VCDGSQVVEGSHLDTALYTWSQFTDESVTEAAMMQLQHRLVT